MYSYNCFTSYQPIDFQYFVLVCLRAQGATKATVEERPKQKTARLSSFVKAPESTGKMLLGPNKKGLFASFPVHFNNMPKRTYINLSLGKIVPSDVAVFVPYHQINPNVYQVEKKVDTPTSGGLEITLVPPIENKKSDDQTGFGNNSIDILKAFQHPIKVKSFLLHI